MGALMVVKSVSVFFHAVSWQSYKALHGWMVSSVWTSNYWTVQCDVIDPIVNRDKLLKVAPDPEMSL